MGKIKKVCFIQDRYFQVQSVLYLSTILTPLTTKTISPIAYFIYFKGLSSASFLRISLKKLIIVLILMPARHLVSSPHLAHSCAMSC